MGSYNYINNITIPTLDSKDDKEKFIKNYMAYMYDRTNAMFEYENLPETIPVRMLELYLQTKGSCCIAKADDGNLYALQGSYGGVPDAYYMPTEYIVANPFLKLSKSYKIHEDCVLCMNDSNMCGLNYIFGLHGSLICENMVSMKIALINNRQTSLITANTDATKASAELYQKRITDGELAVILDKGLDNGVKVQPTRTTNDNTLTSLIEHQQYLKASAFNDIGINANYNMKRESITSSEVELNSESLYPFTDNMLACRELFCEEVNKLFGTNISVKLSSVWEWKKLEADLAIESSELTNETVEIQNENLENQDETDDSEVTEEEISEETPKDEETEDERTVDKDESDI